MLGAQRPGGPAASQPTFRPGGLFVDLDGPILDTSVRHHSCYAALLASRGRTWLDLDSYWALKRARTGTGAVLEATGSADMVEAFTSGWLDLIESPNMLDLDRLQSGALDHLSAWLRAGRVVVVTMRRFEDRARQQVTALGIPMDELVVVSGAQTGAQKASAAAGAIGTIDARRWTWIGDTEVDVEAARTLGCTAWVVENGIRDLEHLRLTEPDRIFPSLDHTPVPNPM